MPTPARTSLAEIVVAARQILEADGPGGVTMQRVAAAVGVRPPSLYKRVRDQADLMHLVANDVATELAATLDAAAVTGEPATDLRQMADAFRAWTERSRSAYALLTSSVPETWRPDADLNARTSALILKATEQLVGPDRALDAARTFVAFVHGFVSLEMVGNFRLGGNPDTAYRFGVASLIESMSRGSAAAD